MEHRWGALWNCIDYTQETWQDMGFIDYDGVDEFQFSVSYLDRAGEVMCKANEVMSRFKMMTQSFKKDSGNRQVDFWQYKYTYRCCQAKGESDVTVQLECLPRYTEADTLDTAPERSIALDRGAGQVACTEGVLRGFRVENLSPDWRYPSCQCHHYVKT